MFKNLLKSIIFILILILLFIPLSLVFEPKNNSHVAGMDLLLTKSIVGERENSIDVLILGDSEAYSAYSPMEMYENYGFTSYVCGTGGQTSDITFSYFKKTLKTQKPKIVVLETNVFFDKTTLDNSIKTSINEIFPFFEYHNRWKNLGLNDFIHKKKYTNTIFNKGFIINKLVNPVENYKEKQYVYTSEKISNLNMMYFKAIKKRCEELGIKLVFITSPTYIYWSYGKNITISKLAKKYNIDYIDLNINNNINIDWNLETFDKGMHVNYSGAKKISEYIGKVFKEKYNLQDHRNDPAYDSWNNDLSIYHQVINYVQ